MTKPYFRDSEQLYNDIKSLVRYPHDGFFVQRLFEILEENAEDYAIGWVDEIPDDANKKKAFLASLGIDFADIEELFEEEIDKLQHKVL